MFFNFNFNFLFCFSKATATGLLICTPLVAVLLGACAGENRPAKSIPKIDQQSTSCLSKSLATINQYFKGQALESEVHATWDCFRSVTIEFGKYVQGGSKSLYTAKSLRRFIEHNFLQMYKPRPEEQHIITDDLLYEVMAVKKLFLGGEEFSVTKGELNEILVWIEELRAISLQFKPYAPMLFDPDYSGEVPSDDVIFNVKNTVDVVSRKFLSRLIEKNSTYELVRMQKLMFELHNLLAWVNPKDKSEDLSEFAPVLGQLKFLFLNTDAKIISNKDYQEMPQLLSEIAGIFIHIKYYVDKNIFYKVDKLLNLKNLLSAVVDFIRRGLLVRESKIIPMKDIEGLISTLGQAKLLPFNLTEVEANSLSKVFFDVVLKQQRANEPQGFTIGKLDLLKEKMFEWGTVQELLLKNQIDLSNSAWREMNEIVTGGWSLNRDEHSRIVITGQAGATNLINLTQLNWFRGLVSLLAGAYISENERKKSLQLSEEELHKAFLDLRPLLVALGLVDRSDLEFDKSLFREANLFMPRSDGNEFLGFHELIEYLHFIFSGIAAGDYFISQLDSRCLSTKGEIEYSCFRDKFVSSHSELLSHMAHFARYVALLPPNEWQRDINVIESVGRVKSARGELLQKNEIYRAFIFLQYIEVVFLRFDNDKSGFIDLKESLPALSHFRRTLASLIGLSETEDAEYIESLFTYLLRYGETPGLTDPLSDLKFLHWRWHRESWKFSISRSSLLQILSVINNLSQ